MSGDVTKRDRLVIFARYPRAGKVKTRLEPALGRDLTVALYRAFLLDAVENWSRTDVYETAVAVADAEDAAEMRELLASELCESTASSVSVVAQRGESLGERMSNALADGFAEGYHRVCVIGSDHPTLQLALLLEAYSPDDTCDVVVGESEDGGYWMIGMDAVHTELFTGMPFSCDTVFAETLRRADALGLSVRCVERWYDVDEGRDLERLFVDADLLGTRTRRIIDALHGRRIDGAREEYA